MALPLSTPFLKNYVLIRWRCLLHGYFEMGVLIFQHSADCPKCQHPADYVEHCGGRTTRELPFTTRFKQTRFGDDDWVINPRREKREKKATEQDDADDERG